MGCERVANANGAVTPLPFVSESLVSKDRGPVFVCHSSTRTHMFR